jgi:hypothetical protein
MTIDKAIIDKAIEAVFDFVGLDFVERGWKYDDRTDIAVVPCGNSVIDVRKLVTAALESAMATPIRDKSSTPDEWIGWTDHQLLEYVGVLYKEELLIIQAKISGYPYETVKKREKVVREIQRRTARSIMGIMELSKKEVVAELASNGFKYDEQWEKKATPGWVKPVKTGAEEVTP